MGILKSGIDRVENDKGYILDNCVPCCAQCNRDKGSSSLCDFVARTWRRYHHLKEKGVLESEDIIADVGIHIPDKLEPF